MGDFKLKDKKDQENNLKKFLFSISLIALFSFILGMIGLYFSGELDMFLDHEIKSNNNTKHYQITKNVSYSENLKNIDVDVSDEDVNIKFENRENIKVYYRGYKNKKRPELKIENKDGKLFIELINPKVYINFSIQLFAKEDSLELYIPIKYKNSFKVNSVSGETKLCNANLKSLSINSSSGDNNLSNIKANKFYLETVSGESNLKDIEITGEFKVESSSGDIYLNNVKSSSLSTYTVSGESQLNNIKTNGKSKIESSSGDTEIKKMTTKRLDFYSVSGELNLETFSGDLDFENSSGDFYGDFAKFNNINIETLSGETQISIPKKYAASFNSDTSSGEVNCDIDNIKKAAHKIKFESSSGDCNVKYR